MERSKRGLTLPPPPSSCYGTLLSTCRKLVNRYAAYHEILTFVRNFNAITFSKRRNLTPPSLEIDPMPMCEYLKLVVLQVCAKPLNSRKKLIPWLYVAWTTLRRPRSLPNLEAGRASGWLFRQVMTSFRALFCSIRARSD